MDVSFFPALANSDQFPSIKFSAVPRLKLSTLSLVQSIDKPQFEFTKCGSTALAVAASLLKKSGNNLIIAPAYHCPAAIEPFIWLDYQVVFYRVNNDLSANIKHVQQLLAQYDVSHSLLIRFFGFDQTCQPFKDLMQQNNITIIEDCAHSIYQFLRASRQTAKPSDAVICSINKMLPTIDGGLLHFNKHSSEYASKPFSHQLQRVKLWSEIKAFAYSVGIMTWLNQWRGLRQCKAPANAAVKSAKAAIKTEQSANSATRCYRYFKPDLMTQDCFSHTKACLFYSKLDQIKQQRRKNFIYLQQQLADCQSGHVLFDDLGSEDVPYILPFLLKDSASFQQIRMHGIQSLRWEEIAQSHCSVSLHYRTHLVQIPCHQHLTQMNLDTIIQQIKSI
jgi:perosamine synthetase